MKAPAHYQAADQNQARFNREVADSLEHILEASGVDYDVVTLTVGTTATLVPHRLGRSWRGWYVVDTATNTNVWRSTSSTATALYVQAGTSSPGTTILVF